MAKDKKVKSKAKPKTAGEPVALIAGPTKSGKKSGGKKKRDGGGLDAIARLIDHPLFGDLIAVGALAAVAAIAEAGKNDSAAVKSSKAVKSAGKAAAAAIGVRLLKEVTASKKA